MGLVIGHLCRHCGLDTLEIACAGCRGRITWSRRGGYRCSGCGEGPTAAACRDCGTVAPLRSDRDAQPADRAVSAAVETDQVKRRSPASVWGAWELAAPPSSGWPIFIALAVFLHAALIVPLIAGRDRPDGASSAAYGMASVTVVDSSTVTQQPTQATPTRDVSDDGAADASPPLEAAAKPDAALDGTAPATATQEPGRGAALLPFDMLPIPTPSPPATKAARRQKTDGPAPSKPAVTRAPRPARHPPPEPQPFDPYATMPDPPPAVAFAPMPPPAPERRSRRAFWWGIWCGVYVSCD